MNLAFAGFNLHCSGPPLANILVFIHINLLFATHPRRENTPRQSEVIEQWPRGCQMAHDPYTQTASPIPLLEETGLLVELYNIGNGRKPML
jgi:hypothetical protein